MSFLVPIGMAIFRAITTSFWTQNLIFVPHLSELHYALRQSFQTRMEVVTTKCQIFFIKMSCIQKKEELAKDLQAILYSSEVAPYQLKLL